MTNEEKILGLLTQMQSDMSSLKAAQDEMRDTIAGIKVRLDVEVNEKFNLLAENQQIILERLPDPEDTQLLERRVDTLELAVRKLNREISELKKAQ